MQTESEITIIGAGAAGLMAGAMLSRSFRVTILEARDRCGGRINTRHDVFADPIEAGAEFIHGDQKLTQELASKYGLSHQSVEGRFYEFREGRLSKEEREDEHWSKLMHTLESLREDTSMNRVLEKHFAGSEFDEMRQRVKAFAEGYDAADLSRVSAFALRDEWRNQDDENQTRLRSGYGDLIRHLEDDFVRNGGRVELESTVRNLRWKPNEVIIETIHGNLFKSSKLVCTIPLGVLKDRRLGFMPELPKHEEAFQKLGFGGVIKFFFRFTPEFHDRIKKRFPKFSFIFSDARIPTWWSQYPSGTPMITGWLAGPSAVGVAGDEKALHQMALDSVAYLVNCSTDEVKKGVVASHIADWITDPFSCGAYAYATVGSEDIIRFITQPVSDTLYFAGEAFYHGPAMGTVEAALQSGSRVAGNILETKKR